MISSELFLGFPQTEEFVKALSQADMALRASFIGGDYLVEVESMGQRFLGRPVSSPVNLKTLKLLEANIYSLLHKLVPDYPTANTPLKLIAVTYE